MSASAPYIHALRFPALTCLYDPVVAATTRERRFKTALIQDAGLLPGQRLLDVGCGTGTLACMASRHSPGTRIQGVDGDAAILRRAVDKAHAAALPVQFDLGLSYELPYAEGHFDHVLSSLFFHHLTAEDKRRTLSEIGRVLKPGGQLHIADWGLRRIP